MYSMILGLGHPIYPGKFISAAIETTSGLFCWRLIFRFIFSLRLIQSRSFIIIFCVAYSLSEAARPNGSEFQSRSVVLGANGMVATSQPLATQIGLSILQRGGSAVDAAIAANAALGLMQPMSNGMGGDLFALVWDPKSQQLYGLNASGRSPTELTRERLFAGGVETSLPQRGPLSVTVPGCVDGWFKLHERFGRLDMKELLAPAANYARQGFPVAPLTAQAWESFVKRNAPFDEPFHSFAETFTRDGHAPRAGELWFNPSLAQTLEALMREGRDVFYEGEIAEAIETTMKRAGGFIRVADLVAHESAWVDPVSVNYRGWDVWEIPPNGQGIAALQILNILEGYDLKAAGFGSAGHVHAFVEAKKLAYADRAKFYADAAFEAVPVSELISKDYAASRRELIDPHRPAADPAPGVLEHGDTVILCTADSDGMMVSLIQSNSAAFGSGVCVPELGFVLQNRGHMFSLDPDHANSYEPNKRPFHTIIPAFISQDGEPLMAFGLMGGAMQPQGHAQIVINLREFGMNLQEAGDAPRIRHTGSIQPFGEVRTMTDGGRVLVEPGISVLTQETLRAWGHQIEERRSGGYGGYQAILRDAATGVYHGASESRQDGMAAGY